MKTELEINKKYGKWLVLKFDKVDERRRRRYFCRCECGLEKSIVASIIFNGNTKSCNKCRAGDLTGKGFGKWIVKGRHSESSKHQHTLWICECTCGKTSLVERCNLVNGTSQGCWECQRNVIITKHFPRIWYRRQIEQAKIRKHFWNLTEDDLWGIWEKQGGKCALTGLNLMISNVAGDMTASLDRINSKKGYELDNVWFVHKHINMMKYRFDLDYFVEMCSLVSGYLQ